MKSTASSARPPGSRCNGPGHALHHGLSSDRLRPYCLNEFISARSVPGVGAFEALTRWGIEPNGTEVVAVSQPNGAASVYAHRNQVNNDPS